MRRRRRRFNVGLVLVLNSPPANESSTWLTATRPSMDPTRYPCLLGNADTQRVWYLSGLCTVLYGACGQGLTLVHFSAQPEPALTQHTPYVPSNIP